MKLRILGCSGGVGVDLRTTSMLVDQDILIDAGSGVGDLTLEEMREIRHIFLTHSHMDHFVFLPLLVDSIFESIKDPIIIHVQPETIQALETHVFNWVIWPDFAKLPTADKPVMRFEPMPAGSVVDIGGRRIESIKVNHIVPGVGYRVASETGAFAFSGDTTTHDHFWQILNARERLDLLIVEAAFANAELDLSKKAGHYTPQLLADDLKKLTHQPDIYLSHTKPGQENVIVEECRKAINGRSITRLFGGEQFTL